MQPEWNKKIKLKLICERKYHWYTRSMEGSTRDRWQLVQEIDGS